MTIDELTQLQGKTAWGVRLDGGAYEVCEGDLIGLRDDPDRPVAFLKVDAQVVEVPYATADRVFTDGTTATRAAIEENERMVDYYTRLAQSHRAASDRLIRASDASVFPLAAELPGSADAPTIAGVI